MNKNILIIFLITIAIGLISYVVWEMIGVVSGTTQPENNLTEIENKVAAIVVIVGVILFPSLLFHFMYNCIKEDKEEREKDNKFDEMLCKKYGDWRLK